MNKIPKTLGKIEVKVLQKDIDKNSNPVELTLKRMYPDFYEVVVLYDTVVFYPKEGKQGIEYTLPKSVWKIHDRIAEGRKIQPFEFILKKQK